MPYEIEIKGLDEMLEAFNKSPQIIAPILEKSLKSCLIEIARIEKQEAPHKTSNLIRTITTEYQPIQGKVYPKAPYAGYVESGTRPHVIRVRRRQVLAAPLSQVKGWTGHTYKGYAIFGKQVMHTGTKANPFVARTVSKVSPFIDKKFFEALNEIHEKL